MVPPAGAAVLGGAVAAGVVVAAATVGAAVAVDVVVGPGLAARGAQATARVAASATMWISFMSACLPVCAVVRCRKDAAQRRGVRERGPARPGTGRVRGS